jgi:hypothetical protein
MPMRAATARSASASSACGQPKARAERILIDTEVQWFWQGTEALDPARREARRMLLLTGARRDEVADEVAPSITARDPRLRLGPLASSAGFMLNTVGRYCKNSVWVRRRSDVKNASA